MIRIFHLIIIQLFILWIWGKFSRTKIYYYCLTLESLLLKCGKSIIFVPTT